MSKERARRREVREAEAAVKAQARAEADARAADQRARKAARDARLRRLGLKSAGRPTGIIAERRRSRVRAIVGLLLFAQIVVWLVRPDWQARFGALVISAFVFLVASVFAL
ncbi:hypothetical protein [Nocardioides marmorisolisilvae]|uniref:Uncharacterized protein n=1 Tax=Nocardioides marmorisolisilvae TaxID=1542737 RepID=A0A3N0DVW1_9ACTN|nr:hypothetical protein [Nocardioides marmorisolisilvae]RNL79701.1 hypothetical protein EFL95_12120 [Nocardioides marmorisolisilvae]